MPTPHKHADILRALANDASLQLERYADLTWSPANLADIATQPNREYRVKPASKVLLPQAYPTPVVSGRGLSCVEITQGLLGSHPARNHMFYHLTAENAYEHYTALMKAHN